MPIDKTGSNWTPTVPTYPTTTTSTPTSTNTSPTTTTPTSPSTSTPSKPQSPLSPKPSPVAPQPSPTTQANNIISRVNRITRLQRPGSVRAGSLILTKSSPSVNGRTFKRFVIEYDDNSDPNVFAARLWVRGYQTGAQLTGGSIPETLPWHLLKVAKSSPFYVDLEASSENVMFGVEMINKNGHGVEDLETMEHILSDTT